MWQRKERGLTKRRSAASFYSRAARGRAQARGRGHRVAGDFSANRFQSSRTDFLTLTGPRYSGFPSDEEKAFVASIQLEFFQVCAGSSGLAGRKFGLC